MVRNEWLNGGATKAGFLWEKQELRKQKSGFRFDMAVNGFSQSL